MRLLLLVILLLSQNILSDGVSTLSKSQYLTLKDNPAVYPNKAQILYLNNYKKGDFLSYRKAQIYGDGVMLFEGSNYDYSDENIRLYVKYEKGALDDIVNCIVDLGLFESVSDELFGIDEVGAETQGYYLSLRIQEKYYTIGFSNYKEVTPKWLPIIEYIESSMDGYMKKENAVTAKAYLETLKGEIETYGRHPLFSDDYLKRYVEENEAH